MSGGINLAQLEAELAGTAGLRAGATGGPAYGDSGGELAELRRQQRQLSLEDATPLARDAAMAYREVVGPSEHLPVQPEPGRGSTFL